ncbi:MULTISPECIES: Wzz/FepE/Etk N-terminal domain-containing protein [unclassified Streptomyces]|uniref:Wzz/FepE/Etk N-terminal domain-containing protein n=1 Tax=unclassified Streptomyces TaxID=2593676 RepID=UPI00136D3777|nr:MULTISPECIES: Wzz/FepE/Etk N-terminal domain-containing protein [unclassified Streptomyces]MYY84958.1 polysaccharide biosynthesis protein [Streptomyces sp. SID335]MYZ16820.1 polysaccharide biosynthesis protein [Streptomyces sp. SID337]NEB45290.1 polysaccharide biosynthesis protein [Streptomyces sp. SID339]
MSDETIRLATVGRILRRRWRLLAVLTLVGALVGYGASVVLFPPRYTASASVLLPGQWEERELLTQAQVATSSSVVDRAAAELGWKDVDATELKDKVGAKATDGNIIKISGTAESPERAQELSDRVAQEFVSFSARLTGGSTDDGTETGPEALRKKVEATNRRISELADSADPGRTVEGVQARTSLEKLRASLEEAMKKLDQAETVSGKAGMVVMGKSPKPTGEAPPTRTQLMAGGALLFLVSAVIGHLAAARTNRRLRTEPEIAAALRSELLGTVDVPDEGRAHRPDGPRAMVRHFLGLDTRWDTPAPQRSADEAGRRIRYRRVCTRLRNKMPAARRLLVVVPEGDEVAHRAAGQLVAESASDPSVNAANRGYPALRVVEVPVSRPVVPDSGAESGALVVLSAGNWTAAELAGIAEACADGRHEIVGVVVAGAVRAREDRPADQPPEKATLALAVRGNATGGPA